MPLPTDNFVAKRVNFTVFVDNDDFAASLTFAIDVGLPEGEARNDAAHAAAHAAFSSLKSAFPGSPISLFRIYEGNDVGTVTDITPPS